MANCVCLGIEGPTVTSFVVTQAAGLSALEFRDCRLAWKQYGSISYGAQTVEAHAVRLRQRQ